jgi:hypothetical protein
MKTLAQMLFLSFLIISCSTSTERPPDISGSLIIGDPFSYGVENYILFPVGTTYSPELIEQKTGLHYKRDKEKSLSFNEYSGASDMVDIRASTEVRNDLSYEHDIRNILFYNQLTGESHPLFSDTLHILSFAIHLDYEKPLIFYRVVKSDFNSDSLYTGEDAILLYTSDLLGHQFTQITPDNQQFVDYTEYLKNGLILAKTRTDANGDGIFSPEDETNFLEMKLAEPAMGRSIFSDSLRNSLREIMAL